MPLGIGPIDRPKTRMFAQCRSALPLDANENGGNKPNYIRYEQYSSWLYAVKIQAIAGSWISAPAPGY